MFPPFCGEAVVCLSYLSIIVDRPRVAVADVEVAGIVRNGGGNVFPSNAAISFSSSL
jgi:hypothetical protein